MRRNSRPVFLVAYSRVVVYLVLRSRNSSKEVVFSAQRHNPKAVVCLVLLLSHNSNKEEVYLVLQLNRSSSKVVVCLETWETHSRSLRSNKEEAFLELEERSHNNSRVADCSETWGPKHKLHSNREFLVKATRFSSNRNRSSSSSNNNNNNNKLRSLSHSRVEYGQSRIYVSLNYALYFPPDCPLTQTCTGQKSVISQIETIYSKWNPESANSSFHTYLYNTFPPDAVPFFRPDPSDNEEKWEEALRKRPNPGAIPFIVKGFWQLGQRILIQEEHLRVLHGRLYEINNGLTDLLNKHDVDITIRAAECRRKHLVLNQKCLALATKTQVLRNRGYVLDSAEEELKQKLASLEKKVFDPALSGRSEEIWARMVSVRERGKQLQYEMERHGLSMKNESEQSLDEETLKKAKKVCCLF